MSNSSNQSETEKALHDIHTAIDNLRKATKDINTQLSTRLEILHNLSLINLSARYIANINGIANKNGDNNG